MNGITVITIFEINANILLLYDTDFQGNNHFVYIANNKEGYNAIELIIKEASKTPDKMVIGLPIHARQFSLNERDKVYFNLVETFGKHRILYNKDDIKEDFEAYLYKDRVDIAWADPEEISIVMFEPGTHVATFSYLMDATPPFNPIDIAQTLSASILHKGFCRLICSRGLPPSSQDIEKHLSQGQFDLPMNTIACPDVWYIMIKTEQTKYVDDKEEFHLDFMSVVSKYKQYSKLIGLKFAVIESCRKHNLPLACGTTSEHRIWEEKDGEKVTNMAGKEDYIVPLSILDPRSIIVGVEQTH